MQPELALAQQLPSNKPYGVQAFADMWLVSVIHICLPVVYVCYLSQHMSQILPPTPFLLHQKIACLAFKAFSKLPCLQNQQPHVLRYHNH